VVIFCYDYAMDDPANSQPGPGADDDLRAQTASRFVARAGLVIDSADGARVVGHIDLGPDHHTPWGVVHGGVYTTAAESAASIGASLAVRDRGQFAVGVHNATDFLRPATSGRAEVIAEPLQQGRVQQLWLVTITNERGGALARGQVRLQNVPLPGVGTA
jgi:1,4-dihydroxy-2-naphthoyl-CoA hydrolase